MNSRRLKDGNGSQLLRTPGVNATRIVETMGATGSTGSTTSEAAEVGRSENADTGTPCQGVRGSVRSRRLDFAGIKAAAMRDLPALLMRWLPDGRVIGREYEARNPRRSDRHLGSFRVNLRTGRWSDFATGDCGGDPISLAAYLFSLSQIEAARRLANMLGVS